MKEVTNPEPLGEGCLCLSEIPLGKIIGHSEIQLRGVGRATALFCRQLFLTRIIHSGTDGTRTKNVTHHGTLAGICFSLGPVRGNHAVS